MNNLELPRCSGSMIVDSMMTGADTTGSANHEEGGGAKASPLSAALLRLLNAAEAAVDCDRQSARVCLERATALLLADQDRGGAPRATKMVCRGGLPRWQANRLVAYIDANLGAPISTRDLIGLAGVSAGHFFRTFKVTFGEAPCAYIAKRRIVRAQELMLTTNEPLCQIALDCGLCDQSHLTRLFRRIVGTTPRAWRHEYARTVGCRSATIFPLSQCV
jgi:AraC family transcriptional regulator